MTPTVDIPYEQVVELAQNGSPLLVRSAGRLLGLGAAEQQALTTTGIPRWAVLTVGLGLGFFVGAWAYRRYPKPLARLVGGISS